MPPTDESAPTTPDWHAMPVADVLTALTTGPEGISADDAVARIARYGANTHPQARRRTLVQRFLAQIDNLLIYVLLGSATVTAMLGHAVDTGVILGVIVINAIFGVIQEGKAEAALDAIRAMISPRASVIRNGRRTNIPASELVPGDILVVEAGDRVSADARVLEGHAIRIDEAALTGESVPVDKSGAAVAHDCVLAERTCMIYSGTLVTAGQGRAVVVATGASSELGRITRMLGAIGDTTTPLIRQMNRFARQLSFGILALCAATLAFALLVRRYPLDEAFLAVVGMAVAAIPEGLPAVMTITLAIGVERMSRRHAIVRHLPAVETLGSVSVICTDKTGTLTRNEMTVRQVATARATYMVEGSGYAPDGRIEMAGSLVRHGASGDAAFDTLIDIAAICNDAHVVNEDGTWVVEGDPMEGALVVLAMKGGRQGGQAVASSRRHGVVPFDAAHRFMAVLTDDAAGGGTRILLKGAPEEVLALCDRQLTHDATAPLDMAHWQATIARFAADGERTLAFAVKPMPADRRALAFADVVDGFVLAGIAGFIDPPRDEAIAAIADCRSAGIDVTMITGDHALTASAIARQLGLTNHERVASGRDFDALDGDALAALARDTHVFARTAPEHKLRLIEALRRDGAVIAMTGDGVNDAPALKRADVGIAMGRKGTEAAKEASQMVLADDNFASIVAAVREGRTVYDNLTKVIAWTLPTSFGETLVVVAAILGGFVLPVTPVQILWINMVSAVALGLVLAFEPAEADVMRHPPRPASQSLLTPLLAWQVVFVSVLFVIGAFGMFWWAEARGLDIAQARTIVVNTIVCFGVFYLFAVRYLRSGSITREGIEGTRPVLIGVGSIFLLQLAFTYLPIMNRLFDTRPITLPDGVRIVLAGVALLVVLEIEKRVRRWMRDRAA
jgi:magnesium-transporting ATPase (P-type)